VICILPDEIRKMLGTVDFNQYHKSALVNEKWSKEISNSDPSDFNSGYMISSGTPGEPIPDSDWSDMCFIAPSIIPASLSLDEEWYNTLYRYLDKSPIEENDYFGNIIRMQVLIDATGQSIQLTYN